MFQLIKKDTLILLRSRSDLTELLFMPFILIAILGLALGNLSMTDFNINAFPVAVVYEGNIEQSLENWAVELRESDYPEEAVSALVTQAEEIAPGEQINSILASEDIQEWMTAESFATVESAETALDEGDVAGVIIIPEEFNEAVWSALFLDEGDALPLTLEVQNIDSVTSDIIRSVLTTYANQFNLEASIALASEGEAETADQQQDSYGEVTNLTAASPITSFQYYTIGMGVMFALYTAPALASRAFHEKKQHVFGRLMISGTKPLTYLGSKLVSGTIITFIQLVILFGLSTLIFGTFRGYSTRFWIDLGMVSFVFSLVVGSITSLLTSLSLYSNSESSSSFFGGVVITLFAFIGGSFTPVEQFSESLRTLGNWTPNGAMMTSYMQLMQGFNLFEVAPLIIRVAGMTVILLAVSVILFPKRRLD